MNQKLVFLYIIPKQFIGAVIGPGGKIIQELQSETETVIVIEEVDNLGIIEIAGKSKEAIKAAIKRIEAIVEVPVKGKTYKGKVKTITSFGAFVQILPNVDGLLHISEIEWRRLDSVSEVLKEGDKIEVKLIDIDNNGKLKLSRKALIPRPE
jgi:polyribonucleotide nucleotidyltransferase